MKPFATCAILLLMSAPSAINSSPDAGLACSQIARSIKNISSITARAIVEGQIDGCRRRYNLSESDWHRLGALKATEELFLNILNQHGFQRTSMLAEDYILRIRARRKNLKLVIGLYEKPAPGYCTGFRKHGRGWLRCLTQLPSSNRVRHMMFFVKAAPVARVANFRMKESFYFETEFTYAGASVCSVSARTTIIPRTQGREILFPARASRRASSSHAWLHTHRRGNSRATNAACPKVLHGRGITGPLSPGEWRVKVPNYDYRFSVARAVTVKGAQYLKAQAGKFIINIDKPVIARVTMERESPGAARCRVAAKLEHSRAGQKYYFRLEVPAQNTGSTRCRRPATISGTVLLRFPAGRWELIGPSSVRIHEIHINHLLRL